MGSTGTATNSGFGAMAADILREVGVAYLVATAPSLFRFTITKSVANNKEFQLVNYSYNFPG